MPCAQLRVVSREQFACLLLRDWGTERTVEARRVHNSPPSTSPVSRFSILNCMRSRSIAPKKNPSLRRFPAVLFFYQNDLRSASTKSVPPRQLPFTRHRFAACFPWIVARASVERLAAGGTERFKSEAFSGTGEGAERQEPASQRKRRATAPSSSRNERARSKVVARASGCDHDATRALVPAGSSRGNAHQKAHS
jgi:hypothetical protein